MLLMQLAAGEFQRSRGSRDSVVELDTMHFGFHEREPGLRQPMPLRNPHRESGEQHQHNQRCLVYAHR